MYLTLCTSTYTLFINIYTYIYIYIYIYIYKYIYIVDPNNISNNDKGHLLSLLIHIVYL